MSDKIYNILYLERNSASGFSIHKVFKPIIAKIPGCIVKEAPSYRATFSGICKNLLWIFVNLRHYKGIIHMTGGPHYFLIPLFGKKTILTIHDLVLLKRSNGIKHALYKILWFRIPICLAKRITCISNTVKKELLNEFKIPENKLHVIYNAVDDSFKYTPQPFNEKCPRILHIGTYWNKNIDRVIEAIEGISCKLVIIGKINDDTKKNLITHNINFINKINLSDNELIKEYELSDIVSFPSIFEGFGMPIIEGQAIGRPVVTSNIMPMKEVANETACLVNPYDTDSIRNGFMRIIKDEEYRNRLIEQGLDNVKRFSSEKILKEYQKIYNTLL